ncbi:MAG: endonuclease/exonuclease/phosphatase family protein [Anaerolineae bacterium]|nr:endonuclease/exonuclease/phosphatase family protein [Anaerolineae bacterium]
MIKLKRIPLGLGLVLSVLTLGSMLGQLHWTLDVLSHFNLQYTLWLMVCLVVGLFIRGRRREVLALIPALVINFVILGPYFLPTTSVASASDTRLRVATLNIHTPNSNYDAILNYIQTYQPDVVMISEAEPALIATFREKISRSYPYLYDESMRGTLGLALLSRQPFLNAETVPLNDQHHRRLLRATIEWQDTTVTIYGIHPLPPLRSRWAESRNSELHTIQTMIANESGPLILLGDFNAAPWSYPMRQLVAATNLQHAALGFGIRPTWYFERIIFGAPLDHVFVSPDWAVTSYTIGGDIGSDHTPVMADITLK